MRQEFVCVRCPVGCLLTVDVNADGTVEVSGNSCVLGERYGAKEAVAPERMVTTLIHVGGVGGTPLPVRTTSPVPKDMMGKIASAVHALEVALPVRIGDVVASDICGTGVDVIATRSLG